MAIYNEGAGGAGDVEAAANIGDNLLVRGDGATKGVQNSGITVDDSDNLSGLGSITYTGVTTSTVTDGGSNVAFILDTSNAISSGDLLSLRNNTTEYLNIDDNANNITIGASGTFGLYTVGTVFNAYANNQQWISINSGSGTFYVARNTTFARFQFGHRSNARTTITGDNASTDVAPTIVEFKGADALLAASTNQDGGNLELNGGAPASGGGVHGLRIMANLPTSDPSVAGALWNNSTVLTVSAG